MEEILFIGLLIIIVGFGVIASSENNTLIFILGMLIIVAGTVLFTTNLLNIENVTEKETAIKCLQGNNPYKMEIRYELKDSIYIPKDTVFIKN